MIVWMKRDDSGMMEIPDDIYKEACDAGLGVPSVAWSDEDMQLFMDDREEFNRRVFRWPTPSKPFPVIQGL
jgi:hypothetical protein